MKILLVEDNPESIESAKMQFADHELTIVSSCEKALGAFRGHCSRWERHKLYDLIMTDMEIPIGEDTLTSGSAIRESNPTSLLPGGLVVALFATKLDVPCLVLTDANGHKSVLGYMIEEIVSSSTRRPSDGGKGLLATNTRPSWIDTPLGKGKDWRAACPEEWIS